MNYLINWRFFDFLFFKVLGNLLMFELNEGCLSLMRVWRLSPKRCLTINTLKSKVECTNCSGHTQKQCIQSLIQVIFGNKYRLLLISRINQDLPIPTCHVYCPECWNISYHTVRPSIPQLMQQDSCHFQVLQSILSKRNELLCSCIGNDCYFSINQLVPATFVTLQHCLAVYISSIVWL